MEMWDMGSGSKSANQEVRTDDEKQSAVKQALIKIQDALSVIDEAGHAVTAGDCRELTAQLAIMSSLVVKNATNSEAAVALIHQSLETSISAFEQHHQYFSQTQTKEVNGIIKRLTSMLRSLRDRHAASKSKSSENIETEGASSHRKSKKNVPPSVKSASETSPNVKPDKSDVVKRQADTRKPCEANNQSADVSRERTPKITLTKTTLMLLMWLLSIIFTSALSVSLARYSGVPKMTDALQQFLSESGFIAPTGSLGDGLVFRFAGGKIVACEVRPR
jgi:hypothetical protein